MKNILIPSDFSSHSLACIRNLAEKFGHQRLNILLVHTLYMPDSITDLILLPRRNEISDYASEPFRYQCYQLQQEYPKQIAAIGLKCFYGNTVRVFENFLEGHRIDLVVHPDGYRFRKLSAESFDPTPFIEKCRREVLVLPQAAVKERKQRFIRMPHMIYSLLPN